MKIISLATAALMLAVPAFGQECAGQDLMATLPPQRIAEIRAATEAVPYHRGLFWQAEKGDQQITLVGTYHFSDPRHDATMERIAPVLEQAATLLVEAGPEEERKLTEAMTRDPDLIMDASGPTLPERLTDSDWDALTAAMQDRGMPAVMVSKLRPWYVSILLSMSPCVMAQVQQTGDAGGLDHRLIVQAQDADIPVQALEPWDTIFTLFSDMSPREEVDMIRTALPVARYADDYTTTLSNAYFQQESWLIWEFGRFDAYDNSGLSRAEVDRQTQLAQEKLMDQRNASWIAPLERAAADAEGKGIVAAFGALHLPGEAGVLRLLEKRGWTISAMP